MSSTKPRLGMYEPSCRPGGPSRYVKSILKYADPEEFDLTVIGHKNGPHGDDDDRAYAIHEIDDPVSPRTATSMRGNGHRVRPMSYARPLMPASIKLWAGFIGQSLRLAKVFRNRPVDVLHTNDTGCEESAVAARMAGIPNIIGTFHVDSTYDLGRDRSTARYRSLEWLSNHCLDRAIAVSEATKADWTRRTRLRSGRVETIHNGIDPEAFRRRLGRAEARGRIGICSDGPAVVGGVGRLDEAKGFAYLIDAVARLVAGGRDLLLVLAGDGPLRGDLMGRAVQLGIGDRVRFLGFLHDVQPVYDASDLFVLPSLCEALGYAHLEAMATELPSVGTLVGGVPEVIVPGETGFLVPPRDPAALASAIGPLLDSHELRHRMGRAGRERVIRYFHERDMARRTIDVYRQMLATGRRRSRREASR